MKTFGTEFKVGLFTLIAAITTGYMFFVLSPDSFETEESAIFYTVLDDAAGIIPKTHVKTNGVTVGKVKSVKLEVNQTRVEMEIDATVKVPKGSTVEIRTRGLLGDKFIEIIRVKDTGEYIKNGGFLPINDDQVDMQQLITLVGAIAKDVKEVSGAFSAALGGEQGAKTVGSIVSDLKEIASSTKGMINENRSDVRSIVQNIRSTTHTLKEVIGDNQKDMEAILVNVRSTTEDLKMFAANARELVTGENRTKLDRIIASFDQTMNDVEKTAKNVALVSDKIERGEGTIGKLVNDDEVISELQAAITDIRDVLKPATKLQMEVDYHGEFNVDETTQHYFNVAFRTRPDKYYLLGFTDTRESVEEKREVRTTEDANTENTTTTTSMSKALKFNLQFAKRWYFTQVRFGLFESTGGLATDFFGLNDKLRLTLEAYDWDNDFTIRRTAHFKAYLSILFFNHIYAMVGVDDPSKKVDDPTDENFGKSRGLDNYFIGAGLRFKDDDLKAIFGTAALTL
ncbi:MAG: MlaD family protein [Bdellovibrionota bacterium]